MVLAAAVFFLDLGHLLDRCGGNLDAVPDFSWNADLSPGEAQRLCFARLFHQRPDVAILDESTSALSADVEASIYRRCVGVGVGVTLISVGHRASLKKFHDLLLELGDDGSWTLTTIQQEATRV